MLSVDVKVGDKVKVGDTLCVIESMKMELPIVSPVNGTIIKIELSEEQVVEAGGLVAIIEY